MGCISFLSQDSKLKVGKNLFSQKQGSGSQTVSPVGVEETSNSSQTHLHRFKDKLLGLKTSEGEDLFPACGAIQDKIYRSHCLNTWHIPGCLPQVTPFASTINERACKHEHFQSDNNTLKLLRKFYANEKQPYEVIQDTATNTDANVMVLRSYGKEDSSSRPSASDLSRQRSSLLSRGRLMVDRAKSTGSSVSEDQERSLCGKSVSPERRTSNSFGLADINLKTEEDLQSYLVKQYDQVVSAGIAVETTTQAMLTVTSRFMADNLHSNPQKSTVHFVRKHLVLTAPQLKEKYEKKTSEENVQNKIAEYKLQIMLLLEMESLLLEHDTSAMEKLTSELVCMLRGVSFLIGATNLRDFLTNVIVANYVTNLPKVLLDIFDELMLPLPQTLAKFASPSAPSSVWGAPLSSAEESLLSAPGSSQPPSNFSDQNSQHAKRSARFIQHPSISDFRQKRQILVDKPKSKPESKANAKDKVRAKLRSSRKKPGVDCNRAKRNLFSEKKPCKSRSKSRTLLTPRQRRRHHSTQGTEKSKLLVPETPSHKQTSKRMLRRQELKRRRDNIKPEVQVVAESPVKEDDEPPALMNKPARYVVRESFYSSNSQPSRHVVRSIELSQKDSGHRSSSQSQSFIRSSQRSQGSLASAVRGDDPLLSPRSSLVKSFLSSPSPEPKSRHTQKHCSTPTRRRSKTKSMTKLDFRSEHGRKDTHSSTTSNKVDAQMIFDGENASDFNLLTSPLKRITSELPEAGFVTPVKQTPLSRLDLLSSVSCPPLLATPPKKTPGSSSSSRLSFRNILSQETNTGLESDGPSACPEGTLDSDIKRISCTSAVAQGDGHPVGQKVVSRNYKAKEKLCEDGNKAVIEHYTRATFSCTDEEVAKHHSSFSKSPKKKNDNASRHWQNSSPSQKRRKNAERSKLNACSNSPKSGKKTLQIIDSGLEEVGVEDDDQIVFSTPQKGFPGKAIPSHFTPSKVTFSKHALISPPTGTGYPPSAEKSTPTKSILKKSPMVKARPVRRVDLKSVTCSNLLDKLKAASLSPEKDSRFHDISSHSRTESNDIPSHSQAESNASAQSVETARQSLYTANVLGNEVPSKDAKANTTILIHTKSPVTKSKTPDSINKWMRKKHHSGSKSSSSSSSGSILSLSFSSPSNDSKSKMSSTSPGTLEGKENAESSHQDLGSCMGNSSASFIKPSRKRNIFSVEETLPTEHHRKISKKRSRSKHEEQKSKKLRLDRMESHAFSPSTNLEIASPDGEGSTSTWSMQFNTRPPSDKNVFSLSTRSQGMSPNSSFSDSSANGAIRQSYILPSGLSEDSSQGFQVQSLAQNPSGEPSTAHTLPDGNSSHRTSHTTVGTVEVPLAADLMKHSSSTSGNSNGSPTQLKFSSDTLTNKQYSPALSANGLLQLIKSPLVPLESRRRTKDQGETVRTRTKSRKHLDLK